MNPLFEFRCPVLYKQMLEIVTRLAQQVAEKRGALPVIMEVCGTHTKIFAQTGLLDSLQGKIKLLSGPGCPVCVTDPRDIDAMLALAGRNGVITATFGDMVKVPGSKTTLEKERAAGKEVKIVDSPWQAVSLAEAHPRKKVIFLAVGFETTAPAVAAGIAQAIKRKVNNFQVYSSLKVLSPALYSLLKNGGAKVDGFILPGHVCAVTGHKIFSYIPDLFNKPAVVGGFEPLDLLAALHTLLKMLGSSSPRLANCYSRLVKKEGNGEAINLIDRFFVKDDSRWRGFGNIPQSGLHLKKEYLTLDTRHQLKATNVPDSTRGNSCRCGDLIQGKIEPAECPLFARKCTPSDPAGPCMVSREGACSSYFHFLYKRRGAEL